MLVATPGYLRELEQKKQASTAQLLFRAARLLNDWALATVQRETGNPHIRAAHTSLLPHLGFAGTRLTELADKLGVSKQAAFQLVEELEAQGMVEKINDPSDGRAKLIRFSKRGERALMDGLRVLAEIERTLAAALGRERFDALHDTLLALMPVLEGARPETGLEKTAPPPPQKTKPKKARPRRTPSF